MILGLGEPVCKEKLQLLSIYSLCCRRLRGDHNVAFELLKGFSSETARLFFSDANRYLRGYNIELKDPET